MFLSRYNDRESTLETSMRRGENGREGSMYKINGLNITVWDDGTVTARKEHWRTSDPRAELPNMTVEEGRITIELQDLAGIILERIPPEELARDLLCVQEVRDELLSGLAHRYSNDYISDEDRRKFLRDIKEEIHDVALGHLVTKLNEIETGLRTKTSRYRWEKAQAFYYRRLWEASEPNPETQPAAHASFLKQWTHPDKLDAALQEGQDPIQLESVGENWHESRAYWRKVLEERFPGAEGASKAVNAFLKAWDKLPAGLHSANDFGAWLNSEDMISGVRGLRALYATPEDVNVTPPADPIQPPAPEEGIVTQPSGVAKITPTDDIPF